MSALENKVIVYDDVCPLCKAYTAGFVRFGLLKNRSGFAEAPPELLQKLDLQRARHEIPLHDLRTGETLYGVDALFVILGTRFPLLKPLFRFRPFRAALYQLYQIITYNRRVIAGSRPPASGFDCAPDVNRFYRWLYIGLAIGGSLLLLKGSFAAPGPVLTATFIAHGLLLTGVFFTRKKLDFVGHWATIILSNALLVSILPAHWAVQSAALILALWMWSRRRPLLQQVKKA